MASSFPKELVDTAVSSECFGGEMNIEKMNFFHKFIMKMVAKSKEANGQKPTAPIPENIDKIADAISRA